MEEDKEQKNKLNAFPKPDPRAFPESSERRAASGTGSKKKTTGGIRPSNFDNPHRQPFRQPDQHSGFSVSNKMVDDYADMSLGGEESEEEVKMPKSSAKTFGIPKTHQLLEEFAMAQLLEHKFLN